MKKIDNTDKQLNISFDVILSWLLYMRLLMTDIWHFIQCKLAKQRCLLLTTVLRAVTAVDNEC